jgi:hypothetical protein
MGRIYILEKNCTNAQNKMRKDNILFLLHSAFLKLIFCQIVGFLIVFYAIYFLAAIFAVFDAFWGGEAHLWCACRRERDRSETTRDRAKHGAGDVADSPTRGASRAPSRTSGATVRVNLRRSGSPYKLCAAQFKLRIKN